MDKLISLIVSLGYLGFVSSNAIFEVDLLRYEALPNKCCDGYRKIHFGPLKCNECDPYFNICLKQLPSGASRCVKTSREDNVHSKDLTNGNIQPNHLSLSLHSWGGSLLVDVDVQDYDSTTKDDDIDHLYYTYTGQPDPGSKTVVINGTKVRLTIAIKIYCAPNYYGSDCKTYCENAASAFCDSRGTRRCKPGYAGTYCTDVVDFTTSYEYASKVITNRAYENNMDTTQKLVDATKRDQASVLSTGATTYTDGRETRNALRTSKNNVQSTEQMSDKDVTTDTVSSKITGQDKVPISITTMADYKNSDRTNMRPLPTQESHASTDGSHVYDVTITESFQTGTTQSTGESGQTLQEVTGYTKTHLSTPVTVASTIHSIIIPEPIELYSCNMVVRSHRAGIHTQVVSVIYSTLSNHPDFSSGYPLGVHAVSSTFETIDNGEEVTDVSYVVNYNGMVLRSESVVRILSQPPVAKVLHDRLRKHNIDRYYPQNSQEVSSLRKHQAWVSNHLPFVVVTACVLFIIILVPSICIVRRTCANKTPSKSKKLNKSERKEVTSSSSEKGAYDMQYSIENPAYDFDNSWPAYKNSYA